LRSLLPLLDIEATFASLQKDVRSDDAAVLKKRNDVLHFGDALKDFSDTAALILQLDLVISVDTSVSLTSPVHWGSLSGYYCPTIPIGDGCWIGTIARGTQV